MVGAKDFDVHLISGIMLVESVVEVVIASYGRSADSYDDVAER